MVNVNAKKVLYLSAAVLAIQLLLTKFVYPFIFGQTTQTMFSIQPASGIGGQVFGDKIIGYLTGIIPLNLGSLMVWISMFIGTFLLVYAGMYLYEQRTVKLPQGKNLTQRLIALLLYGHIVLYVLLLVLKWGTVPGLALNLAIGLIVNLVFVSAGVVLSSKYLNFPKI